MAARRTIVLSGVEELAKFHDERRAATGSTLKPGYLAEVTAADEVTNHAVAGGAHAGYVVKEDDFQGRTIDDAYDVGDPVMLHRCQPGQEIHLVLKAGQAATRTSYLTSNGDGTVKVAAGTDVKSFKALEPITAVTDTFIAAVRM